MGDRIDSALRMARALLLVAGLVTLAFGTCAAHEDADAVVPETNSQQFLSQEVADGIAKDWVKAWMGIAKTCTAKHPECEALRLLYKPNVVLICAGFCNPKPKDPMPTFTWMHGGRHSSVKPFDHINDLTNPHLYVVEARPQGKDVIHLVYHMVGCGQWFDRPYRGYNRLQRGPSGSWADPRASIDLFPFPATDGKTAARHLLESTTTSAGSTDETKKTTNPDTKATDEAALFSKIFSQIMNDDTQLRDDNMNRVYEADAVVIDMFDPEVKPKFQTSASSVREGHKGGIPLFRGGLKQTVVEAQRDKNDDRVIHLIYMRAFKKGRAYRGYSRLQKCQTHGDWKIAVDMYPLPTPGAKGPHHFPVLEGR